MGTTQGGARVRGGRSAAATVVTAVAAGTVLALLGGCADAATAGSTTGSSAGSSTGSSVGSTTGGADAAGTTCTVQAPDAALPADGVALGVNPDWGAGTLADFASATGVVPAAAVSFTALPVPQASVEAVHQAAEQVRTQGGVLVLTLEPTDGLAAVTPDVVADLVALLEDVTSGGVPVLVRLAHEMNGSWYAWGQQPIAYTATFRAVAEAVHAQVPGAQMLWAPNYGGGYPFTGGAHAAVPGSADAAALDTDGDGAVTGADDPYAPYWPGDDAVDWVGMSLYHWGSAYPWGEDELPEDGKLVAQLTGTYAGLGGDDSALPDFAGTYGTGHGKPLALVETAALVSEGADAATGLAIRRAWWRQVLGPALPAAVPSLRLVNWFDWDKQEPEVGGVVRWAVSTDPAVAAAFRADLPAWARQADAVIPCAEAGEG
ncbi:glycosyl hydrolase [Cellulomonas marina]|uniref:Glycosyl hydrolase family 26 n=1 Tax=Cellulomonas marina TaxID=988821 RepID=A0A1I0X5P7_9CELL|nr:glycosyl hydrolase [Cellulomonas marina]GIG28974.1 hypothetical protein Cma02nite_15740 [Cellulomonas marina]SFA96369.1 Glycosyl hydrolase family 26 [Cellulomonas marina]